MIKTGRRVAGVVLAGGKGARMGTPKALLCLPDGRGYLAAALSVLAAAGCDPLLAVLGARAEEVRELLDDSGDGTADVVVNSGWREGMSTSLRAGLQALAGREGIDAALIHLVDLPDVGPAVIERVIDAAREMPGGLRGSLVRATYDGAPGHPVLIGADHWPGVLASLDGDAGARAYLRAHPHQVVDVSDLATGRDVDTPEERLEFEAEYRA